MKGLRNGYTLLRQEKYQQALDCFKATLKKAKDPQTIKSCVYGKARAQIGLRNYQTAEDILVHLNRLYPTWEAPYSALARVYETQHKYNEADRVYLKAINNKCRSPKLLKQYEWFLTHNIPKPQPMLVPGFQAYKQVQPQKQLQAAHLGAVNTEQSHKFREHPKGF